ncbi:hypothetical protein BKA93DRAFT_65375 [Sparassis latifolia]
MTRQAWRAKGRQLKGTKHMRLLFSYFVILVPAFSLRLDTPQRRTSRHEDPACRHSPASLSTAPDDTISIAREGQTKDEMNTTLLQPSCSAYPRTCRTLLCHPCSHVIEEAGRHGLIVMY